MSVYRRMLGRELPCTCRELLGLEPRKLSFRQEELLARRIAMGSADAGVLYRVALSHIANEQWGAAIRLLASALELDHSHVPSRLALAVAHEGVGQHELGAKNLDSILTSDAIDPDTILCAAGLAWERAGNLRLAM